MIKRLLSAICIIITIALATFSLPISNSYAVQPEGAGGGETTNSGDGDGDGDGSGSGGGAASFSGSCRYLAGFTSWDCGVNISNQDSLKSGIWTIAVNVLTDITVLAAYLVVGYVIYGGYLYVFSGGEPNKVLAGKKTLSQAFIGLAIVMSAHLIMSTIRFALLGNGNLSDCVNTQCVDPGSLFVNGVQWAIGIGGAVAAIFVIYGAITYITSSGDPSKLQKAKQMITYALIGLAIVALAEVITAFVSSRIRSANNNAFINQTIISKEVYEIKTT